MIFTDLNILLKEYAWIAAVVLAVIILIIVLFFLIRNAKKTKKHDCEFEANIIEALGGIGNIITAEAKMSRLNAQLIDYSLTNDARLKELGVSRIIKMTTKVTLLLGDKTQSVVELIKNLKK